MANKILGSAVFIDTTANSVIADAISLTGVVFTPSSANGYVDILDASGGNAFVRFGGATAADTKYIDLAATPIHLSTGLHVTVSNCQATFIYRRAGT